MPLKVLASCPKQCKSKQEPQGLVWSLKRRSVHGNLCKSPAGRGRPGHGATLQRDPARLLPEEEFQSKAVSANESVCTVLLLTSVSLSDSTLTQAFVLKHIPGHRCETDIRGWECGVLAGQAPEHAPHSTRASCGDPQHPYSSFTDTLQGFL